MNNLTGLAAWLDKAYCNIASLMDERAQLEQQNVKLTVHLQLQDHQRYEKGAKDIMP